MLADGAIQFMMTTIQLAMRTHLEEVRGEMIFQMILGTVAPPCASELFYIESPEANEMP